MANNDPWAEFNPQSAPAAPVAAPGLGRPIIRKGAEPKAPQSKVVKDNYLIDPNTGSAAPIVGLPPSAGSNKTSYTPLTAEEVAGLNLPPGSYQRSSEGKIERIGGDGKSGKNPAEEQRQNAAALLAAAGVDLEKGIDPIADLIKDSTSGRLQALGANAYGAVTGDATDGMENIAKLQTLVSDMTLQLTGGSLGNQISNADREFIMQRVGNLGDPNVPASARLAAWEQVKARMGNVLGVQPGQPEQDETPQPTLAPSTGGTRSLIDPKKQELGGKITGLMSRGADRNTIMGFAVRNDPALRNDPKFRAWVDKALAHRRKHPNSKFTVDPSFYTTEAPLSEQEQQSNETAQSGVGSAVAHFGDAVTAGNLGNIAGLVGGDEEQVDRALATQSQLNPGASMAGDVGGGVVAALGGEAALGRLGMGPGLLRSLAADSTYGGVSGGSNSDADNVLGRLADAGKSAVAAGAGSFVGQKALSGAGRSVQGVSSPTVGYVAREIPDALTVGQMVSQSGRGGAMVKGIEDRLSGIPVLGDTINARRLEGLQKMNSKAFDRALEPIKDNVAGSYGEDAVSVAQDKVSQAFSRALAGKSAAVDHAFIVDATKAKLAIQKLPRLGDEIGDSIDELVNEYFDPATGTISGENMQALLRGLQDIKGAYANDPLAHRVGKSVELVSHSVENMFRRQAPEVMPEYDAAKLAFKRLSTLEEAVLKGKNTGGVFTSAQLGLSDRANTIRYGGKHKAAAGGGEFHEYQRNMQEVLPSKVPDSGTAGRLIVPAALVGAGTGADYASGGSGAGLTLATLLTLAYSRKGQALGRVLTRPGGAKAKAVGNQIRKTARIGGAVAGTQAALGTTRE